MRVCVCLCRDNIMTINILSRLRSAACGAWWNNSSRRARSRESGFSSRVQSRELIWTRTDLHEIDGGESRQPRLVTRSTRRTAVSRCARAQNAAVDLILWSRATHITGFLDPNRRADDRFVRRPPIMHGEQLRLHAEALMRAKANNLLRNAGADLDETGIISNRMRDWIVLLLNYPTTRHCIADVRKQMPRMVVWITH